MQKVVTKIFIYSSISFGIVGILLVLIGGLDGQSTALSEVLVRILQATIFVILPSFALSIASKYFDGKF